MFSSRLPVVSVRVCELVCVQCGSIHSDCENNFHSKCVRISRIQLLKLFKKFTHRPYSFPFAGIFSIGTPDIDYDVPYQRYIFLFRLDIWNGYGINICNYWYFIMKTDECCWIMLLTMNFWGSMRFIPRINVYSSSKTFFLSKRVYECRAYHNHCLSKTYEHMYKHYMIIYYWVEGDKRMLVNNGKILQYQSLSELSKSDWWMELEIFNFMKSHHCSHYSRCLLTLNPISLLIQRHQQTRERINTIPYIYTIIIMLAHTCLRTQNI